MRRIGMLLVAIVCACGGSTEPASVPWYRGKWTAVSMDGKPLPLPVSQNALYTNRYDSLGVTFGAGYSSLWAQYTLIHRDGPQSVLFCASEVAVSDRADTLRAAVTYDAFTKCAPGPSSWTFTRDGNLMRTTWDGHDVRLRKEP